MSRTTFGDADEFDMARLQMLVVAGLWLAAAAALVRSRLRQQPHRHWMAGLDALRHLDTHR